MANVASERIPVYLQNFEYQTIDLDLDDEIPSERKSCENSEESHTGPAIAHRLSCSSTESVTSTFASTGSSASPSTMSASSKGTVYGSKGRRSSLRVAAHASSGSKKSVHMGSVSVVALDGEDFAFNALSDMM
mmetsp:Transcript_10143/g.22840  ORF Transcript_10143/g.22840 Transcript_10143/m.22840 type:complete len:133 (+) Transcript_10143:74-472(+)